MRVLIHERYGLSELARRRSDAPRRADQFNRPGYQADIIALDGDPLKDITFVRRVVFVMKGGTVYKQQSKR
jgi:hypothetical protein